MREKNERPVPINEDNFRNQLPFVLNIELLKQKGLGEEKPNQRYFALTNKYKRLLENYLLKYLPLEQIDTNMRKDDLGFVPIKTPDMDFYQATSGMGLNYIYLRNNLYIEKLSEEALAALESMKNEAEAELFIKQTLKDVVYPYNEDNHILFYGPENGNFLVDSASIVIGIRHNEFDVELEDEEFKENLLEKQNIIAQVSLVVSICGIKALGLPVLMLQYNEFSVSKF